MNHELSLPSPETVESPAGEFELGTWLGRRQAFGVMAGKTSAADVDCLRQIRDTKLYTCKSATWEEFCSKYLGAGRSQVNRIIGYLEKYGPQFFALTQLTRVPPAVYKAIEPHLSEAGLTVDGETFALSTDNAQQVAAAVAELRKRAEAQVAAPPKDPFEVVEKRFQDLIGRLEALTPTLDPGQKAALAALLTRLQDTASAAGLPLAA